MDIANRTNRIVWLGLYNLTDTTYWATLFSWGARKEIGPGKSISVNVSGAKVKAVFWDQGALGTKLAPAKIVLNSSLTINETGGIDIVYNHLGEPRPMDRIDTVIVLMLENRSFDNLLGWLYEPANEPARNLPVATPPTFDGLVAKRYWNTPVASEHDTAPESKRIYAGKVVGSDRKPDPNPREVCSSFVEQMFGSPAPKAGAEPNMWGFVQNYAVKAKGGDVNGIMEAYTPEQVPVLSWLAKNYAVCDRWFGSLPSETWPNRSFLHAGTSFGRLNNCDGPETEDCVPNFLPYAGQRTIFDVLDEHKIPWRLFQDALMQGTLTSAQFWTIAQKMHRSAGDFYYFKKTVESDELPRYIFLEPSYGLDPNDQHPPHKISSGEALLLKTYEILANSPAWYRSLLVITYDEHGGCYDHVSPPAAVAPDGHVPQFGVGGINPFKQYGPRVPAIVVSPYVEAGTVFRGTQGREFDHTSIVASLRDWLMPGLSDILGANPRIAAAPTFWNLLTRATPRAPEKPPALAPDVTGLPADDSVTAGQRQVIALGEAERQMVDAARIDGAAPPRAEEELADLAYALLEELGESDHLNELPESLIGTARSS
jgi:phospholipase C